MLAGKSSLLKALAKYVLTTGIVQAMACLLDFFKVILAH